MTGMREDLERKIHHQAPRPRLTHWSTEGALHPGVDPAACQECNPEEPANCSNPACVGGRVDTSPPTVDRAPWLASDTECPVCDGTGERSGIVTHTAAPCGTCGHVRSSHLHGCHAQVGDLTCRCNEYVLPPASGEPRPS